MILKLDPVRLAQLAQNMKLEHAMSSACTGTGMAEVVHVLVHEIYGVNAFGSFSCEKPTFKQRFFKDVVDGANST